MAQKRMASQHHAPKTSSKATTNADFLAVKSISTVLSSTLEIRTRALTPNVKVKNTTSPFRNDKGNAPLTFSYGFLL